MGKRKLPLDAFEFYFSCGIERSYLTVAEYFNVSKTAVANLADRENWQERLKEREQEAQNALNRKVSETIEQMNTRHLKSLRVIQGKALEALKALPLTAAIDGIRALELAIRQERVIRGEPSDRTVVARTEEEIDNLIDARREVDQRIRDLDRIEDRRTHQLRRDQGNGRLLGEPESDEPESV